MNCVCIYQPTFPIDTIATSAVPCWPMLEVSTRPHWQRRNTCGGQACSGVGIGEGANLLTAQTATALLSTAITMVMTEAACITTIPAAATGFRNYSKWAVHHWPAHQWVSVSTPAVGITAMQFRTCGPASVLAALCSVVTRHGVIAPCSHLHMPAERTKGTARDLRDSYWANSVKINFERPPCAVLLISVEKSPRKYTSSALGPSGISCPPVCQSTYGMVPTGGATTM